MSENMEDKSLWFDMGGSITSYESFSVGVVAGYLYADDYITRLYAERAGYGLADAKDTYINDVAKWFVDNGIVEISVPILPQYSEQFIEGIECFESIFRKEMARYADNEND